MLKSVIIGLRNNFGGIMARKSRIDWSKVKIRIIPADTENPNPLNPCAKLTPEEREQEIITICGRIWARAMKEKMLKDQANK